MPTRLVTGLSFLRPVTAAASSGGWTFTAGDQTPDVSLGTFFVANAASAITITNFDVATLPTGGQENGRIIYVLSQTGGVTTIQDSAGGIRTSRMTLVQNGTTQLTITTGGNLVMQNNELICFIRYAGSWIQLDKSVQI